MGQETPERNLDQTLANDSTNQTSSEDRTPAPLSDERQPLMPAPLIVERSGQSPRSGPTGPRSVAGKQRSSQNAIKSGIFSKATLVKGESQLDYESLLEGLWESFQPEGKLEEILVEKLASISWRYRRLLVADGVQFRKQTELVDFLSKVDVGGLDRLVRYESTLERGFDRTLTQLDRAQRTRRGQPLPPQLDIKIS